MSDGARADPALGPRRALGLVRALCTACAVTACGGASSELTPKEAAAERAYAAGRYLEAAERFSESARASSKRRDREEARYRQAMSFERAGRPADERAVLAELLREYPDGTRAPRAMYDLARLDIRQGRAEDGYRALGELLRRYPESGLAPAALHACAEQRLGEGGEKAVQSYLEELAPAVVTTRLAEYVDYEHARSRERAGDLADARDEYLRLAERFPYPRGVFWDDALYRTGELYAALGAPRDAIAVFERLLAEREPSFLQGSYERGRYAEAAFRVAELYRDALHDPARARLAFERFFVAYPTSRLRDDAAFSAARLALSAGDRDGACRLVRSLVASSPESRYVACAPALCPAVHTPPRTGPCHDYLLRTSP